MGCDWMSSHAARSNPAFSWMPRDATCRDTITRGVSLQSAIDLVPSHEIPRDAIGVPMGTHPRPQRRPIHTSSIAIGRFSYASSIHAQHVVISASCTSASYSKVLFVVALNPFGTVVTFWGRTTKNLSGVSPQWEVRC